MAMPRRPALNIPPVAPRHGPTLRQAIRAALVLLAGFFFTCAMVGVGLKLILAIALS